MARCLARISTGDMLDCSDEQTGLAHFLVVRLELSSIISAL